MSTWNKDNCIITAIGNQALTEIAAKGGTMSFDSVWTCDQRVSPEALYGLTDLPKKNQRMTLTKYNQISSGYTINVQITNADLTTPYAIEMVGVYMKLNGFNNGNPFLYMVLLVDEGTADQMTNISRSTYKYSIYLYHTNKATLNISLTPGDYVSVEAFEESMQGVNKDIASLVYNADFTDESTVVDTKGSIWLYTENYDTHPFVFPINNRMTASPVLFIHNYIGGLLYDNKGKVYIDDTGPYSLVPCDYTEGQQPEAYFNNENLMCTVNGNMIYVYNYFPRAEYIPVNRELYSDFNALPKEEGVYSLVGTSANSPISIPSGNMWSCTILKTDEILICIAINDYNNNIYRRSSESNGVWSLSDTTPWVSIGGGEGIQTATATFVNTSGTPTNSSNYLKIMRGDTTNPLTAGDVIACTLTALSTLTGSTSITVRYVDGDSVVTKYIYNANGTERTPCCQLPKHFLLKYDGTNFYLLTPLNITTTLATSDPELTAGKYGDIWYTY